MKKILFFILFLTSTSYSQEKWDSIKVTSNFYLQTYEWVGEHYQYISKDTITSFEIINNSFNKFCKFFISEKNILIGEDFVTITIHKPYTFRLIKIPSFEEILINKKVY